MIMDEGRLISKFTPADYVDCFTKVVANGVSADELFQRMFCQFQAWVRGLLRLRDAIVKPFGLKTGTSFTDRIIERNGEEIVIGADDKHLSFRVSVFCRKQYATAGTAEASVSANIPKTSIAEVTTVMKFHNMLGRIYFVGIWIFHRLIVETLFRRATA